MGDAGNHPDARVLFATGAAPGRRQVGATGIAAALQNGAMRIKWLSSYRIKDRDLGRVPGSTTDE
jgi:hypothetical protein